MSRSDKGVPVFGEKGGFAVGKDGEVNTVGAAIGRPIFMASFFLFTLPTPLEPRGLLLLSRATKVSKNALECLRSERTKNHRIVVIYHQVGDKRGVTTLFAVIPSVIFRFLLCASWVLFSAHLYLKQLSTELTATLSLSHSLFSSATRCCLPSCGSQNSLRLGAPMNFDRCAIITSLNLPQAVLR